jgi:VacB/RNase II family 3'-5' exoribonuclease
MYRQVMATDDRSNRVTLRLIAHRAMLERGLEPDFSPAVLAELARMEARTEPAAAECDLRHLIWSSIDNDDSLDLDQLTVAQALPGGSYRVLVAIADVGARVARGSAVDAHAQTNTTSVYTAAEIFPMLPERLSTDLSSLAERQDRPAVVVEMTIGEDGSMVGADLYQALVHNHAKLAYDSVAAWLDGSGPLPEAIAAVPGLDATLTLQDAAAQKLRALRHEQGALELKTVEARAVFAADRIQDLAPQEKNRAKQLIEDLMIAANGVTARFLASKGFPSLRRVVRKPKRWERIVELAAEVDERLPAAPDARSLARFLARRQAADPLRFPDLSLAVVKLLGAGEYAVDLPGQAVPGHFGLAVKDYTHSTAPNRRFPDLVTQRLVKAALAGTQPPYGADELGALASHCTTQEDAANKVERQVAKSAAALLLSSHVGERFDAIVTGAAAKGTWVRIFKPPVEGKVVEGSADLDVGRRVRVQLVRTDVERGFIDFKRVDDAGRG